MIPRALAARFIMRGKVKIAKQPLKDLKFLSYGIHQLEITGPLVFYLLRK
jgi:hypothetical protein